MEIHAEISGIIPESLKGIPEEISEHLSILETTEEFLKKLMKKPLEKFLEEFLGYFLEEFWKESQGKTH